MPDTQQKWTTTLTVTAAEAKLNIRGLLRMWLVPKRLQHYLRIREDIKVNGVYRPYNSTVTVGDVVTITLRADELQTPVQTYLPDNSLSLPMLFENDQLLVVNKPSGVKSHPNRTDEAGTVMNFLTAQLAPQQVQPWMVHRLDMATSGAMIVAKTPLVVPILDRQISDKHIHRTYQAWVEGRFEHSTGSFTDKIGRDPNDRRKRLINGVGAQTAETHYQVLKETNKASLVSLTLMTGRTHQLRVHLAGNGHPIIGDPLYEQNLAYFQPKRMLLHAVQLSLILPFSGERVTIDAPLPAAFSESKS
ncbi:MAG TPA: RluA family pseudouridine synthase [Lactobacillus sp.]|nr:RluA family pseudouridine synthase [Lactobacillus sp.]